MSRRIVDPVEYETKVNPTNKTLVKDFLIEKKAQQKTKTTLTQYEGDMRIVLTIILRHFDNKSLIELTRKDIRNMAIIFQEREMSNARVNRLLSTLRSSLEYFSDDDDYEYDFNLGSKVKGLPKNPVREITFLTEGQINWLKDELVKREEPLMATYLMLSYVSAARKNEVYQVLKDGLEDRFYTNTVIGKRQKKFKLYYNKEVQDLIKAYLDFRGEDDIPHLFVKVYRNGRKSLVNRSTFNYWCEIMSRMLRDREGREIHINPHAFRHSRLTNLSRDEGVPLEKLKTLANHESVATTESYLQERDEEDIALIFGMDVSDFKE